uniref:Integrase core domain-containing protein n=2 Tax=Candidatus Kentrum sp. LPFa TaxID=2126335 RepID=A0A450Y4Q2_9GAMM|nr:MAG: Integrase core domain-containing protein [Candidatus Kentron sp. LPFa]
MEFFGGVTQLLVPDNLKSAVSRADRYAPQINPTYAELAHHYGTAVLPARPYKPKDKAKAEVAVQVVERWILARLRHRRFFSLVELNTAIRQLRGQMNDRPLQRHKVSCPGHWCRRVRIPNWCASPSRASWLDLFGTSYARKCRNWPRNE